MRIEISAGGICGIAVSDYQSDLQGYLSDADAVISSFKAVQNSTCNLSGGVDNLWSALDGLDQRVRAEEEAREQAGRIQSGSESFLQLAGRIDGQVASRVEQNRDEGYRVGSWMSPRPGAEDTPWYEKAWNLLCGMTESIADGVENLWEGAKDSAGKLWKGIKAWYEENWYDIVNWGVTIVCVVGSMAIIAATGGAGILLIAAISAGSAAIIAATRSITTQQRDKGSVDWTEVAKEAAVAAAVGAVTGAIGAGIGGALTSGLSGTSWAAPLLNSSSTATRMAAGAAIGSISEVLSGVASRGVAEATESYLENGSVRFGDVWDAAMDPQQIVLDAAIGGFSGGVSSAKKPKETMEDFIDSERTANTKSEQRILSELEDAGELDIRYSELSNSYVHTDAPLVSEKPIEIDMPFNAKSQTMDIDEFYRQVYGQEDGLNNLTVEEYFKQYDEFQTNGRAHSGDTAQAEYRKIAEAVTAEEMLEMDPNLSQAEAYQKAKDMYKKSDALHDPDQNTGGDPTQIHGLGGRSENRSIGSLWGHGRAKKLHDEIIRLTEGMTAEEMKETYLHVKLNIR